MMPIELVVAENDELPDLIDNAVMNWREAKERLYVVGDPLFIYRASLKYREGRDDKLPLNLEFIGLDDRTLRSTLAEHLQVRDALVINSRWRSRLLALVPPLPYAAAACPLLATARCAQAGATLIATPRDGAMIPARLLNPERRVAA